MGQLDESERTRADTLLQFSCRSDEACRRHLRQMTYRCGQAPPFPRTRGLETVLTSNGLNDFYLGTKVVSQTRVGLWGVLER